MNIKDIARLAGVSPSTVSKIINRKDDNISPQTRKKVLEIVDQYQYTPFSNVLERSAGKTRLVGALVPNSAQSYYANILRSLESSLSPRGYNLIISNTDGDSARELDAFRLLSSRKVECIVILGEFQNQALEGELLASGLPYVILDPNNTISGSIKILFNDQKSLEDLIDHFFAKGHEKIALVVDRKDQHLKRYFRRHMERRRRVYDNSMVFSVTDPGNEVEGILEIVLKTGSRAILAGNMNIARELYKSASLRHLDVGRDFSLVGFDDQDYGDAMTPELTCIKFPFGGYGDAVVRVAMDLIQGKASPGSVHMVDALLHLGESVRENAQENRTHITVIGTINMDVMMAVEYLPRTGETIIIRDKAVLPGGKGANQAIGAARLGASVSIIGRLGNDLYGKELYHNLHAANVGVKGIVFDNDCDTGRAYIYMTDQAEYSIGVHAGANDRLDQKQIDKFREEILRADYCLVQAEIPLSTVEYLGALCRENGVKLILKPSPVREFSDQLLRGISLLVPNETEIHRLVSGDISLEEKVDVLLQRGVPQVILTLGENGCYYACPDTALYFKAAQVNVVDTTGASDAFISALAVFLCDGCPMTKAIEYANIAAGLSITRVGVQSALADRKGVEMMLQNYPFRRDTRPL